MTTKPRYIYIEKWEKFQHYGELRKPVWIKNYLDVLDNEDYLSLSPSDRCLLEGLWKLTGQVGNGRVLANTRALRARLRIKNVRLEPLIQAGFITLRASKALAPRYQSASAEVRGSSKEEPKREERANASAKGAATRSEDNGTRPERDPALATRAAALKADLARSLVAKSEALNE